MKKLFSLILLIACANVATADQREGMIFWKLGNKSLKSGSNDDAIIYYNKAIYEYENERNPNYNDIYIDIAKAYAQKNDYENALAHLGYAMHASTDLSNEVWNLQMIRALNDLIWIQFKLQNLNEANEAIASLEKMRDFLQGYCNLNDYQIYRFSYEDFENATNAHEKIDQAFLEVTRLALLSVLEFEDQEIDLWERYRESQRYFRDNQE